MLDKAQELDQLLKYNSIHYYLKCDSDHVFVYNTSDKLDPKYKKRSALIIPISPDKIVRVAAMKAPQDLTEQAVKEEIIKSQNFMDALRQRLITICPDEEAYEKRASADALKEIERYETSKGVSSLDDILDRKAIEVVDVTEKQRNEETTIEVGVNPTVMDCLVRDDATEEDKLLIIKEMADTLERKDWQYIFDNAEGEIKNFALTKLN